MKTSAVRWVVVRSMLLIAALKAGEARASGPELGYHGSSRDYGRSLDVNDPVSAANGAYHFSIPLFSLGGPLGLECRLFYRSDLSRSGLELPEAFWLSPYASALTDMALGTGVYATVYLPDSRHVSFARDAESNWVPTAAWVDLGWGTYTDNVPRIRYQLKETDSALYLADPAAGRLHVFQHYMTSTGTKYWRIGWTLDRNGNRLDFAYAGASVARPAGVSDGLGRSLAFNYLGWLTNVADQTGRSVGFHQESSGADNGFVRTLRAITNAAGQGIRFSYGGSLDSLQHLITATRKPAGNAPFVQAYASRTLNGTAFPRVVSQWDAFSNQFALAYATNSGTVTVSAPDGATNRYLHSSTHGSPVELTDAGGSTVQFARDGNAQLAGVVDRRGNTTSFGYDLAAGFPSAATNANGEVIRFAWTPVEQTFVHPTNGETVAATFFDLARVDYPDGTSESFAYDARGNATGRIDRAGQAWSTAFDARGLPLAATNPAGGWVRYEYNHDATLAAVSNSDGVAVSYGYDALKRRNRATRADGASAAWGYDELDRVTAYTNELGEATRYAYDANGNLVSATDPLGNAATRTYDAMDRPVVFSNRSGRAAAFTYDTCGRLAAVTNPGGPGVAFAYDPHGRLAGYAIADSEWVFARDAEGLPVAATDPLGDAAGVARDARGAIVAGTNALGHATAYERDALGRVVRRTDPLGRVWRYAYDAAGRLASVALPGGGTASNHYDAAGRLVGVVDLNTQEWTFAHTPAGLPLSATDPLANVRQIVHDANGRPASGTLPDGATWTRQFDLAGRPTNLSWSGGPSLAYAYDANGRIVAADQVELSYDPDGLVTGSVQAGAACAYSYDSAGRLSEIVYPGGALTVAYSYNPETGLPENVADDLAGGGVAFVHDAAFRPAMEIRGNGTLRSLARDEANRLVGILDFEDLEFPVLDILYDYDSAGLVTQQVATVPLPPFGLFASSIATQTYDAASQIAGAPYAYDLRGRLTNLPGRTLAWDNAGRLVQASSATLEYDGLGRPVRRIEAGQTNGLYHSFANGLDGLLAERNENTGQWLRFYVWSPTGRLLYLIDAAHGNAPLYYHFDRAGNTLALTDATGAVAVAYAYDPFGRLLGQTGASDQPFLFLGQFGVRREGTQGLYHARARFYDAESGRFLSREPLWPLVGRPETLNPYAYANNDPVNFADPSGRDSLPYDFYENFDPSQYSEEQLEYLWMLHCPRARVTLFYMDPVVNCGIDSPPATAAPTAEPAAALPFSGASFNRNNPFLWSIDRYAEYNLKLSEGSGRTTLFYMDPAVNCGADPVAETQGPRRSTLFYLDFAVDYGRDPATVPAYSYVQELLATHVGDNEAPAKAAHAMFANPNQPMATAFGGLSDLFALMIQTRLLRGSQAEADQLLAELLLYYGDLATTRREVQHSFDAFHQRYDR